MKRNPAGSYGALFVVAKGLSTEVRLSGRKKKRTTAAMKSLVEPISPWLQKCLMKSTQRTHTLQRECVEFMWDFLMNKLFILVACIRIHPCFSTTLHTGRGLSKMFLLECILETFHWCLSTLPLKRN